MHEGDRAITVCERGRKETEGAVIIGWKGMEQNEKQFHQILNQIGKYSANYGFLFLLNKKKKKLYYENRINESTHDSEQLWNTLYYLLSPPHLI